MALLPATPLTLTGGCMCTGIRYTLTVPALSARPLAPRALPTPINASGTTVPTRLPFIDIDHCQDCRRASGAILQCWFICPQSWIEFQLQPRTQQRTGSASHAEGFHPANAVGYACSDIVNPTEAVVEGTYLGHYESSDGIHRCFCSRCGTGLTYSSSRDRGPNWTLGAIVDLAVGTLDKGSFEQVRPERHGWWDSGTEWVKDMVEGKDQWLIRHPTGNVGQEVKSDRGSGA